MPFKKSVDRGREGKRKVLCMVRNLSAGSFPSLYLFVKLNQFFIEVQLIHNTILVSGMIGLHGWFNSKESA